LKKNNILPFVILAFFLSAMQVFYGCGTAASKKDVMPTPELTCDKDADEALKERRYEKSVILHEFYLKEHPDNGLAMYHLGFSHGQLGDHENEVKCYEKAIDLGFYGASIFFNLGMVYGEMGKYEDSVRIFKKAMKIEPGRADNHFGLALAYQQMGSYEPAEEEFKKALELDPEDVDAIYFLGAQYVAAGRIDEAENLLEKLTKIDPDNEMALELKRMLEKEK
jgi:tetratricopeptide (TPR) repeat protein